MKNEKTIKNVGKGSCEEELPSRFARTTLTSGDTINRAMNNYAKKAPRPEPISIFMMGTRAR